MSLKNYVIQVVNKRRRQKHAKRKLITRLLTAYCTNGRSNIRYHETFPMVAFFVATCKEKVCTCTCTKPLNAMYSLSWDEHRWDFNMSFFNGIQLR